MPIGIVDGRMARANLSQLRVVEYAAAGTKDCFLEMEAFL
jgi:hypothetical protein